MPDAIVIGAGPNGLVAANRLADAGWSVHVLEEQPEPGGAVRSAELTEPGFVHDVFSAFYPLAAASPAFTRLELERWGLRWRHGPLVVAHPALDGSCAVLSRDLDETAASLDAFAPGDGDAWRELYGWLDRVGEPLLQAMTRPFPPVVAGAQLLAQLRGDLPRFARLGVLSMRRLAEERFRGEGGRRLLAGNALHADLTPETALGGFFGWFLCALGQSVGYPFPEGGAGQLTAALVRRLEAHGGTVTCGTRVERVLVRGGRAVGVRTAAGDELGARRAVLADVSVQSLLLDLVGPEHLPARTLRDVRERTQLDSATFKLDWALDGPIPWRSAEVRRAPVVHVAESLDELTVSTGELARGLVPARPFLVFGQYSMGDETRCPPGKEVAWAYTHVPQEVRGDAGGGGLTGRWDEAEAEELAERMEQRVEELAPGFRALIRARHVLTPAGLEARDANLLGGALNGGTAQLHQQAIFRPTPGLGRPETPVRGLFLASASAHPGGGVHGGPGEIAAVAALRGERLKRTAFAVGAAAAAAALVRRGR